MVQTRQFGGLKIMVAAVVQGFLDFSEILLRRDLKILLTVEGKDRTHVLLQGCKGSELKHVSKQRENDHADFRLNAAGGAAASVPGGPRSFIRVSFRGAGFRFLSTK